MYTLQELAQKAKAPPVTTRGDESVLEAQAGVQPRAQQETSSVSPVAHQQRWVLPSVGVSDIINWLLRYWWLIVLMALVGAAAGITFGKTAKPRFTAGTDILVAPSNLQLVPNDVYATNQQAESQLMDIESKLRLLTSGNVLQRVVDELNLQMIRNLTEQKRGRCPVFWVAHQRRVMPLIRSRQKIFLPCVSCRRGLMRAALSALI